MGLLEKAKSELEAGRPRKGSGLFAKAIQARSVIPPPQTESELPPVYMGDLATGQKPLAPRISDIPSQSEPYPFSQADLDSFSEEMRSMGQSEDSILAAFVRIDEALPLSALALFTSGETPLLLCAARGFSARKSAPKSLPQGAFGDLENGNPLTRKAQDLILDSLGEIRASTIRAYAVQNERSKTRAIWLYADDRIEADEELALAFARLFAATPLPFGSNATVDEISPSLAALRLPLGSGKAVVLRFGFHDFLANGLPLLPGLRPEILFPPLVRSFSVVLGVEGKAYCLEGAKIVAILYSKEKMDTELALVQMRKSLKRALPYIAASDFPAGEAISVDLASVGALEIFERFCSG